MWPATRRSARGRFAPRSVALARRDSGDRARGRDPRRIARGLRREGRAQRVLRRRRHRRDRRERGRARRSGDRRLPRKDRARGRDRPRRRQHRSPSSSSLLSRSCRGSSTRSRSASGRSRSRRSQDRPSSPTIVLFDGRSSRLRGAAPARRLRRRRRPRSSSPATADLGRAGTAASSAAGISLGRKLDVVVTDLEMRHGADHRRVDRRGQADTGFPEASERLASRSSPSGSRSSWTKFVSTCSSSTGTPARGALRRACAPARGPPRAARRGGRARRRPAAATIPAWRIAPPKRCFSRHARSISSCEPRAAHRAGSRAPSRDRASRCRTATAISEGSTPSAIEALRSRAPSRWTASPSSRAGRDDLVELVERPDAPARAVVRVLEREHGDALVRDLRARLGGARGPAPA